MKRARRTFAIWTVVVLLAGAVAVTSVLGVRAYRVGMVRQSNAYAMQSAGQLIVEHMRLHPGAWPSNWAELRDTCAASNSGIFSTNADEEIAELKGRIEIDWM